jgi:protein gp37
MERSSYAEMILMQTRLSNFGIITKAKHVDSHPKMFDKIDKTWNPVIGCLHNCSYCWARRLAETRLKDMAKYRDGFKPKLVDYELSKKFKNRFVFACDMADLFGDWVPPEWIVSVLGAINNSPTSQFLLLTKNPKRYKEFLDLYPENVVFGATIETNRGYAVSNAPSTVERYKSMAELPFDNKLISIEPVMDFDLDVFAQWMKDIKPAIVYIGYDNYNNGLSEPSLSKTKQLIKQLKTFTGVRTKTLREANQ